MPELGLYSVGMLLDARKFVEAQHDFADMGIKTGKVSFDVPRMIARKDEVVVTHGGVAALLDGNGVTSLPEEDAFTPTGRLVTPLTEGKADVTGGTRHSGAGFCASEISPAPLTMTSSLIPPAR